MRLKTIRTLAGSLAITSIVSVLSFTSVSAIQSEQGETTYTEEMECIHLVTEPDDVSENVYYVMKGHKDDPSSFTWVENGITGKALQLDGDTQHVRLATAVVKELSEFTFSAWVNWAGNFDEKEQRLLCVYKNENHSLIVSPQSIDASQRLDGIQLTLEHPQLEPVSLHHEVEGNVSSALPVNEWHHIAVTLSDAAVALYIDGTLYASQTLENFSVNAMDPYRLVIGSEFEGDAQFMGLVDNAFLYTTVLDKDQIGLLAQNKQPEKGVQPTTKQEELATRPYVDNTSSQDESADRSVFSPMLLAILGTCVGLIIVLALVLSLYRRKTQRWPEEDHL